MRLVPLAEGGGVDLDDSALHKGVRPDKLVVRGIVYLPSPPDQPPASSQCTNVNTHDTNQPRLLRNVLAAPRKVARLEAERAVLDIPAAHTHAVHALRAELGARRLAAELELSLLAVVRALRAGG